MEECPAAILTQKQRDDMIEICKNAAKKMTGFGDRAVYDAHETGYIELIGNARVTQDGNTVTGNKLRITNVSGPDSKTHVQGNVRIVYYPQPADKEKTA